LDNTLGNFVDNGVGTNTEQMEAYSYIVFMDGSVCKAKNGSSGQIDFSSTNVTATWEYARDHLTSGRTWMETVALKGNLTINGSILIPPYTALVGPATLTLANGANCDLLKTSATGLNGYILISDLRLYGNKAQNTLGSGIHFYGFWFSRILNVWIEDFADSGITMQNSDTYNSWDDFFSNVYVYYCNKVGWNFTSTSDMEINNVNIGDIADGDCLYINGGGSINVANLHVWGALGDGRAGLHLNDTADVNIVNLFSESNYFGILAEDANGFKISNGRSDVNTNDGIHIIGNTIKWFFSNFGANSNQGYGLYSESQRGQYHGGTVSVNGKNGLYLDQASYVSISGVEVLRNIGAGLNLTNWCSNTVIDSCVIWDWEPQLQDYGVVVENAWYIDIVNNIFSNNAVNATFITGEHVAFKIENNAGFVTENSGTATNSTATTFVFNHGLAETPTGVWASFNTTEITGWTWTATSTEITITVVGMTADRTCYWMAEYKP